LKKQGKEKGNAKRQNWELGKRKGRQVVGREKKNIRKKGTKSTKQVGSK